MVGRIDFSAFNAKPYHYELALAELFADIAKDIVFLSIV